MYHLFKQTRIYEGRPYCGPTSDGSPAEWKTLAEAKTAQQMFNERNPVGWNIYDAETLKLVDGHDFHGMSSNA
jgi:hypothetical protein